MWNSSHVAWLELYSYHSTCEEFYTLAFAHRYFQCARNHTIYRVIKTQFLEIFLDRTTKNWHNTAKTDKTPTPRCTLKHLAYPWSLSSVLLTSIPVASVNRCPLQPSNRTIPCLLCATDRTRTWGTVSEVWEALKNLERGVVVASRISWNLWFHMI